MKCCIAIPVYKTDLTDFEAASLRQVIKVLGKHDIYIFAPKSLDLTPLERYIVEGTMPMVKRFEDKYFIDRRGYSNLCLERKFYEAFAEYDYMLLYQLDAWVFRDELMKFCEMGYDYIGAPHGPFINGKPSVGNGGFSLRKISKLIEKANIFDPSKGRWEEDQQICLEHREHFNIAPLEIAYKFSVQNRFPPYSFDLPFGCHAPELFRWNLYWSHYINLNNF